MLAYLCLPSSSRAYYETLWIQDSAEVKRAYWRAVSCGRCSLVLYSTGVNMGRAGVLINFVTGLSAV